MADDAFLVYHQYLLKRSRLGSIYRKWWLYPVLSRQLPGRVLDIGCGIGDFLKHRGANTVGVDVNPHNVASCVRDGLDAHVITGGKYPFGDAVFDSAITDNVLEHLPEPNPLLDEARRVLKPGGTLLVGVPGRRGYASDPDHKRFYDRQTLRQTLESFGFKTKRMISMPLPLSWLDENVSQYCVYGVFTKS
jgi:SAM-dependent methyltransferase